MAELKDTNCRQSEKLDLIVDKLSEERGGWRTLMALGGAAGCDAVPDAIKFDMFDMAVNAGPRMAIREVQAVGHPKAWVCTTAGSPGTWTSEGNL